MINKILNLSGILVFIFGIFFSIQTIARSFSTDYFLVWAVNKYASIIEPQKLQNIYSAESKVKISKEIESYAIAKQDMFLLKSLYLRKDFNLCGTPFLFTVLKIFQHDEYRIDRFCYGIFNLSLIIISFIIFFKIFDVNIYVIIWLLAWLLMAYSPFKISISIGNINEIVLFLTCVYHFLQFKSYNYSEGFLIGCMIFLKPFFIISFVLILIFHLVSRKYKESLIYLTGFFSSVVFVILITCTVFDLQNGWLGWKEYLNQLDIQYWSDSIQWGNFSLSAAVFSFYNFNVTIFIVLILSLLTIYFVIKKLEIIRKNQNNNALTDLIYIFNVKLLLFWIGYIFFELVSPLVWYHYFTLNIVPFIYLFFHKKRIIGIVACLIFGVPQILNSLNINQINIIFVYNIILIIVVYELICLLNKIIKHHSQIISD